MNNDKVKELRKAWENRGQSTKYERLDNFLTAEFAKGRRTFSAQELIDYDVKTLSEWFLKHGYDVQFKTSPLDNAGLPENESSQ